MIGFDTVQPHFFPFGDGLAQASPGNPEGEGMGHNGFAAGGVNRINGVLEFRPVFRNMVGAAASQVLFKNFRNRPGFTGFHEPTGEMHPSDNLTAGHFIQFFQCDIQTRVPHQLYHRLIPVFPPAADFRKKFFKRPLRPDLQTQSEEMKFSGRKVDFGFHTGNKTD